MSATEGQFGCLQSPLRDSSIPAENTGGQFGFLQSKLCKLTWCTGILEYTWFVSFQFLIGRKECITGQKRSAHLGLSVNFYLNLEYSNFLVQRNHFATI